MSAGSGTNRRGVGAIVVVSALLLAGCTNPFSPEGTEPGVYKGASDPLFEEPAEERDAALRERFELIQSR